MKKFMYITDVDDGVILINTDKIMFILRDSCVIKMQDETRFVVKAEELDEILTELERRR